MQLAQKMPSKRKVAAAEDKKEAPPAKKTKKEKTEETAEHSKEVAPYPRRLPPRIIQTITNNCS